MDDLVALLASTTRISATSWNGKQSGAALLKHYFIAKNAQHLTLLVNPSPA